MSLAPKLDLRQSQSLVMTPQLQQAIKLLQLPNLELDGFVAQQIEENPFLERGEAEAEGGPVEAPAAEPEPAATSPLDGKEAKVQIDGDDDGWPEAKEPPAADAAFGPVRSGGTDFDDSAPNLEEVLTRAVSLHDHLLEQLHLLRADPRERLIGLHLIDLIDEAGYLRGELALVAERLGCGVLEVEAVLARIQGFDPTGVGARSVAECLALQLRERDRLDPAMQALLDHLGLLARGDLPALLQATGVDAEDLAEMIAELRALDPKPGLAFGREPPQAVIPDILVSALPGGGFRVELNAATLPRVLVDHAYHARVSQGARDPKARAFLAERLQSANWLVKALDQRARTVLRVAEAVVEHQGGFLLRGVQHLRPLGLKDIAAVTGLHESTVSRAAAEKWVQTPRGNLPLKYFFTNAVGDGEGAHAAEAIRQQIKTMVEREDPALVLSDDQIVERLRAAGVAIARRTIAKYRESLGIPSSVQRRRQKAFGLA